MTLPPGWIANPRPGEALLPPYTGDHTADWEAGRGGAHGFQPKTFTNPDGDIAPVPAMAITAELAAVMSGDPTAGYPTHGG